MLIRPQEKRRDTAQRWAERRTREELIHTVALLFQRRAQDLVELNARYLWAQQLPEIEAKRVARKNAQQKLAKDPKSVAIAEAKTDARRFWLERRLGQHPKLKTVDQFAMAACRKWPALESIGTLRKWAAEWEKAERARPGVKKIWMAFLSRKHPLAAVYKDDGVVVPAPDVVGAAAAKDGVADFVVAKALAVEFNEERKAAKRRSQQVR